MSAGLTYILLIINCINTNFQAQISSYFTSKQNKMTTLFFLLDITTVDSWLVTHTYIKHFLQSRLVNH